MKTQRLLIILVVAFFVFSCWAASVRWPATTAKLEDAPHNQDGARTSVAINNVADALRS